jgi:hypothetical protein
VSVLSLAGSLPVRTTPERAWRAWRAWSRVDGEVAWEGRGAGIHGGSSGPSGGTWT